MKKAVLIIHGYAGAIYDMEYLLNDLQLDKNFDVFAFTLPGHDSYSKDLSKADEWIKKSESMIKFLIDNKYKDIYLIGHSMGGVIASFLASKYKEVKKLVLAAPAFRYLKLKDGKLDIISSIKLIPELKEDYGMDQLIDRIVKTPLSSVREFFNLVDKYQDCPKKINIPLLIIQGLDDVVVPLESSRYVYGNVKSSLCKLVYMKKTDHNIYRSKRKDLAIKVTHNFLKKRYYKIKKEEITI